MSMTLRRILHGVGLLVVLCFTLFPFYWMVSSSFKDQTDLLASPPVWFFTPTLSNYADIFADEKVFGAIANSLIVATLTTALSVILGAPAAYALARFNFRGKSDLWFWFISNRMISPIVLALPVYILALQLKLLDTHLVLDPDLSHVQPADCRMDMYRSIPLHTDRTGTGGASRWSKPVHDLPEDLCSARASGNRRLGNL